MKSMVKFAVVAALGLVLVGCNDQAKQDLLKCQEDGQKATAEMTTVKAELDAAKEAAVVTANQIADLTAANSALLERVAGYEAAAAALVPAVVEPAPKAAAKKPAAKKPEPAAPARITTSTGVKSPIVKPKAKGKFQ